MATLPDDNGAFDIDFTCNPVIEGCQDPAACNYNPDANVEAATVTSGAACAQTLLARQFSSTCTTASVTDGMVRPTL